MTAPKRVAIRAFGKNKTGLEALVAQGIAIRMETLPSFQFTIGNADLEILIGKQDDIGTYVKDKKTLETRMTRAFTDSESRPKLVLTGPSNDEVMAMARGFATHELPAAHPRHISLNEFYASPIFNPNAVIGAVPHMLAEIGDTTIPPSWNPNPTELKFNVVNPDASEGKLTLSIVKSPTVAPQSRLKVRLNNRSIGYTMLDKKQKFVSFGIKPGMFRSTGNKITIEPVLATPTEGFSCASRAEMPTLMVSNQSKLQIKSFAGPAQADLNQFAASGAPLFASAPNSTAIV